MLFAEGQRPDADALDAAVEATDRLTLTHRISGDEQGFTPASEAGGMTGCELLRDGMTYDLTGLAPALPVAVPAIHHRYGLSPDTASGTFEALSLAPGPHLAAGARSMPVVRTLAGIAASLTQTLPGMFALAWPPARTLIGAEFFTSSVSAWLSGGAFPSLGFTAFADEPQGGMLSEGLAWFTGQELRIANDIAKDRANAARLGVRLINQLVSQGKVTANEYIIAPDGGRLALEPTRDGKTVRVRRA